MSEETKLRKVVTQPINLIYRYLQNKSIVQIWLKENKNTRIEGILIGFDEFMNVVLDNATEINVKKNTKKNLNRIMLKGDSITLIMSVKD